MGRIIGLKHRVKRTAENEERPTLVAIKESGKVRTLDLTDETAELDFVLGRFPTAWREVEANEDISKFPPHHVVEQKKRGSEAEMVKKVPTAYEGLHAGDTVAMILGGSGDRIAFAFSRQAEMLGQDTAVLRVPPFVLKAYRGVVAKDDDHLTVMNLSESSPELFYEAGPRDREFIAMREAYRARQDAIKARMGCGLRLRQRIIGRVFLSEDGRYPEGRIEDQYDAVKATDAIFQTLLNEETSRNKDLKKAVQALDVWRELFAPIEGCGETIAAGILSAVGDIRSFIVEPDLQGAHSAEEIAIRRNKAMQKGAAKLKAFLGVHVLLDGRFPRKRRNEVANWNPAGRQSLYLLADQFNRRPDSIWGQKLLHYKAVFRLKHPNVEIGEGGKKRFTNGHIHKRAIWRTLTKFVERLYRDWLRIEENRVRSDRAQAA